MLTSMRAGYLLVTLVLGCGRVGFEPAIDERGAPGDGGMGGSDVPPGDGGPADALTDAPQVACADIQLGSAVGTGVAIGTTVGAGDDHALCLGDMSPDLSYGWVAPTTGMFRIDTCSSGGGWDSSLHVVSGTCTGPQVACEDDGCGVHEMVTITATAGDAFVIWLDGFAGLESGPYVLSITAL